MNVGAEPSGCLRRLVATLARAWAALGKHIRVNPPAAAGSSSRQSDGSSQKHARQLAMHLLFAIAASPLGIAGADSPAADSEIARLIENLGNDRYATRARAKEKLQQFGLEAFDDLHNAQYHPDNEIAMAARFLVSSLMVSWSSDTDPPEVREVLTEYGAQDESERNNRIDMLSDLTDRKGLIALARLARFEPSLRLSRLAALAAMRQPMSDVAADRKRDADMVLQTLGDSDRQAALWLRTYAHDLINGEYSSDRWRQLIRQQRELVDSAATEVSGRSSVLELVRVCASRAAQSGIRDEAISLATAHIDLIEPATRNLVEACTWAIDNGLHPFVLELQDRHQRMVIDSLAVDSLPAAVARRDLANMLAELQRSQDVVDVLTPLAERIGRDEKLRRRMNNVLIARGQIQSNIDYHKALVLIASGETTAAQPLLQRAYRAFPENIDILISMYRLYGGQQWEAQVGQQLHEATRRHRLEAQQAKLRLRQLGPAANPAVAEIYNQYAWLVCNTEGNFQEALDYSLKSLEFDADEESMGARLDTCARCYFALGEIEQAIATQKRALKYLPHSPPLKRQLKEFEATLSGENP